MIPVIFLTGIEIENMDETTLKKAVKDTTLFSKLTPLQKTQIISLLQEQGNTVRVLGRWINDAGALRQSDIGISVDSAVDIAKESADIILLEKIDGIGRRSARRKKDIRQYTIST